MADRFGWPQFVGAVAAVYKQLPAREQAETTILAGNYGEAGALDLLGPAEHLPVAISPQNTYYFWGQGTPAGAVVIATDFQRTDLTPYFRSVRQAATVPGQDGIQNEEVGRAVDLPRPENAVGINLAAPAELLLNARLGTVHVAPPMRGQ